MENFKKFMDWTRKLPLWLRAIVYCVLVGAFLLFTVFPFNSCGITQSTINNLNSDSANLEMEVNPNNSTSVTASPTVDAQFH